MAWLEDAIKENRIPTTEEMDEVDPNDPNKDTVMIMCYNSHWNRWPNYKPWNKERKTCTEPGCDQRLFDSSTICSLRTWDPKRKTKSRVRKT